MPEEDCCVECCVAVVLGVMEGGGEGDVGGGEEEFWEWARLIGENSLRRSTAEFLEGKLGRGGGLTGARRGVVFDEY